MKKYLISIENEGSERLTQFFSQSSFARYRSDFNKIGICGRDLPSSEYYRLGVARQAEPLSPGELGCTLSHVQALSDFILSESEYALVLEDDLIQVNDLDLNSIENDIKKLGLNECFLFSLCGIQLQVNNKIRGGKLKYQLCGKDILKLHPFYIPQLCYTCAYIVDKAMAKLLIEYHQPPHICDHWDELNQLGRDFHFYAAFLFDHPEISENNIAQSAIEKERLLRTMRTRKAKPFYYKLITSIKKKWLRFFTKTYFTN